ncbi:MAG TPA: D-alanine--D-alanine ligase [Alphaproteobacteria bacterium]|nr:D-alanine--D-alanine ligase [Alphaproteobacteria bacterium]
MKNIFIIGLEPFNLKLLQELPGAGEYRFHDLLGYRKAVRPEGGHIDLPGLLNLAEQQLAGFSGSIDAIIGYWDFPSSVIAPILRHRHGIVAPSLEAVAACEHKIWSRIEQRRVIPEMVPRFDAVDPFADDPFSQISVDFPFWLKPVKAHSSYLGFKIRSHADFEEHLPVIRENIHIFAEPFDAFLELVDVPEELAGVGGSYCIAEEIISAGQQCTLEGYVQSGEVTVYGVVDSIRSGKHRSCFARYQYPSQLPRHVHTRMVEAAAGVIRQIDYDNAPFNAEFFWDRQSDEIRILEINTRISKSHCPLFKMVDGVSHQQVAIDLALGHRPDFPSRGGSHRLAAKFMLRVFEDGQVRRIPAASDIAALQERFPDAMVRMLVDEGQRLAHLSFQDSYSFELAEIFLGANNQTELLEKYETALDLLPFEIVPAPSEAA